MFKKRIAIQDNRERYEKLQLIIKLSVLEGPFYIYALLECIKLDKAVLAFKLE